MPAPARLLAAAVTAAALATATITAAVTDPVAASASTHCTAWGAMPHRVALHSERTTVSLVLRGSSGCYNQRTDNGATANLVFPSGSRENMRWRHFGGTQSVTMYADLVRSGTYRLTGGNVQVYDRSYERVPWSWNSTTMIVKRAAHVFDANAGGGVVSGRAMRFTKYGWQAYRGKRVYVSRRAVGGSSWHRLGSVLAGRHGAVRFVTPTSSRYVFRLTLTQTDTVWGARARVRG